VFDSWTPFEHSIDAVPLQGQARTFRLRATTDDSSYTAFYLDTLSLVARSCLP
jgi:hypothetical protein